MRKSFLLHPIAVVRDIIGMPQPRFAELTGTGESTLAKIESLRLPLSKEMAIRITNEVGVSTRWLMNGDPKAPPIADEMRFMDDDRKPVAFTKQLFDECRAAVAAGESPDVKAEVPFLDLQAMGSSAEKRGTARMFNYKVATAVGDLSREFPIDQADLKLRWTRFASMKRLEYQIVQSSPSAITALEKATSEPSDPMLILLLRSIVDHGVNIGCIDPRRVPPAQPVSVPTAARVQRKPKQRPAKKRRPSS